MNGQEIKTALGINIKNLRGIREYSQAELAERADISIIYLSNIERGVKYPKPAILAQITEALEVEVYELFISNHITKTVPKTIPYNNKKLVNILSKKMNQKLIKAMDDVFRPYM